MELSRFELASLAQEAAAAGLGMSEDEKSKLRQILTEYRDAVIMRIEQAAGGTGAEQGAPGSAERAFKDRRRELLGVKALEDLERREQEERSKLITERQAYRKATSAPAPGPVPPAGP
jgi:hypothetical protein